MVKESLLEAKFSYMKTRPIFVSLRIKDKILVLSPIRTNSPFPRSRLQALNWL